MADADPFRRRLPIPSLVCTIARETRGTVRVRIRIGLLAVALVVMALPAVAQEKEFLEINQQVLTLRQAGKYLQAVPVAKRGLEHVEKAFGKEHVYASVMHNNLAELYRMQGWYAQAERHYERAIAIMEKARGPDHANVASFLNNLAVLYETQGRYVEAEPLYKRALQIRRKALGEEHRGVATTLNNLAELYRARGRYAEAFALHTRALAIREKALGKTHVEVATSLNNLAMVHRVQGRDSDAEAAFKRAQSIFEKKLGRDHPNVASVLSNLAALYQHQGRLRDAGPLLLRAYKIRKRALGLMHTSVAFSANNLAEFYRTQKRFKVAEPLYKLALIVFEKLLGKSHEHTGAVLNNLGASADDEGRHKEAVTYYERALKISEDQLGPDHANVGVILSRLASLYGKVGRSADEKRLRERLALMAPEGTRHVPLYFATNRSRAQSGFGADLGKDVTHGLVLARVPALEVDNRAGRLSESFGQLETAKTGTLTAAGKLEVVKTTPFDDVAAFVSSARKDQARSARFKNQALVFVHGYNTGFDGAMKRAAQVAFDLEFDGILIPFAWPSQGETTGYIKDRRMSLQSVDVLADVLKELKQTMPGVRIHLLAHSMGNQVLLRALCKIASGDGKKERLFGQVISAHPDISTDDFDTLTKCLQPVVSGVTLYVNKEDLALRVRCGGTLCRAGNTARGYGAADVIDTTQMSAGLFKSLTGGYDHDIFVRNPLLFSDITRLLMTGQRPVDKRTPEFHASKDGDGRTLWVYDKARNPAVAEAASRQ